MGPLVFAPPATKSWRQAWDKRAHFSIVIQTFNGAATHLKMRFENLKQLETQHCISLVLRSRMNAFV